MRKLIMACALVASTVTTGWGQTDKLMDMLDDGGDKKKEPVMATFKATRIVNSSTVEQLSPGVLDVRILHRFGRVSDGTSNFFGIDNATTRIGLDYGITKWLMAGIGHNTLRKANDGFIKAKLLSQKTNGGSPITVSYYGNIWVMGGEAPTMANGYDYYFSNRLMYTNQLLIARKFSNKLSLQLMPTIVHQNLVDSTKYSNNTFALGIGGRFKVSHRVAITGEYFYRFNNTDMLASGLKTYNTLSIGADIETGGHVFQLFFSNSLGIAEPMFLTQTSDTWSKGQLHFGFNISRVFTVVKPKEFRKDGAKEW